MKKLLVVLFALVLTISLFACGKEELKTPLTYEEFLAADLNTDVAIEGFVQGYESFYGGTMTMFLADKDGNGYFIYNGLIKEEDVAYVFKGAKIHAEGLKIDYSGEVELSNAQLTVLKGERFIAEPVDLTDSLTNSNAATLYPNKFFKVTGRLDGYSDTEEPFYKNWDNNGELGNCDLYFEVVTAKDLFQFNLRRYMTDSNPTTDLYNMVAGFTKADLGKTFEFTGFIYMYNGAAQARIVAINELK